VLFKCRDRRVPCKNLLGLLGDTIDFSASVGADTCVCRVETRLDAFQECTKSGAPGGDLFRPYLHGQFE
jgi:hypothetical protein